jgi:F420-dependent oxidoreductase-like protein
MKLGLQLGYWMSQPPQGIDQLLRAAEDAGFDAVFAAEAYGSDAFTPLAWWGRETERLRLGTALAQISARTPTSTAMHALTLDHLTHGRAILGLGVSGPQVVEGWYGQPFSRPLARTREYVDIVRQVLARQEPVRSDGDHYRLPYDGAGASHDGKPLKSIVHPLRADLPIWLGAEGPKNVALAAEIADGWLAIHYSPVMADTYNTWLDEGFARPGARHTRGSFEIAATVNMVITDGEEETRAARDALRPYLALYMGGMGSRDQNFHKQLFERMGYADLATEVQRKFEAGDQLEAMNLIPDALIDQLSIIGDAAGVRAQVKEWEDSGVTMLLVSPASADELWRIAETLGSA